MVLIFTFPVMSDIEHFFIYLLVIYISSLEECLFGSFVFFYY